MGTFRLSRRQFLGLGLSAAVVALRARLGRAAGIPVADADADAAFLPALSLREELAAGRRTCGSVAELYLARARARGGRGGLDAFIDLDRGAVLSQARALDARPAAERAALPLLGLPIAVKDNVCTRDFPTTAGSAALAGWRPGFDAEIVARLRRAGAVVFGKTNLDEFAVGFASGNPVYGQTLNPWDAARISGGSSGGSAAAVAAGLCAAAIGTDTGGSLRIPASYCGVVGFRPSTLRVSHAGILGLSVERDAAGPLARTVRDAHALFAAIADAPGPAPDFASASLRGRRVADLTRYRAGCDPEILAALDRTVEVLRRAGARTAPVETGRFRDAGEIAGRLFQLEAAERIVDHVRAAHPGDSDAQCVARLGPALAANPAFRLRLDDAERRRELEALRGRRARLRGYFAKLFRDWDLLILPTTLCLPPSPDALARGGEELRSAHFRNNNPASVAGLPALSLPVGLSRGGLPLGVQLIGAEGRDEDLLADAHALERELDFRPRPPNW
jgi:Asp-tRNA(Asn)/Glu-tRNA(Gln) amidotransferase A subunit family amidase